MDLESAIADCLNTGDGKQPQRDSDLPQSDSLGERELEILRLIADGLSNQEIADKCFLAFSTVKWYIREIYSKLQVGSRTQAVARAREMKLLD